MHDFLSTMSQNVTVMDMTTASVMDEKLPLEFADERIAKMLDKTYNPVIMCMGLVGNVLSFVTLVFTSLRATSTCIYLAVIAVTDCVILIIALAFSIRTFVGEAEFYMRNGWHCGAMYFVFYFSIHFNVLLLLAMTVDRYIVVRFPLKARRLCTPGRALKVTAGLGFFCFALHFQILFTRDLIPTGNPESPLTCWHPDSGVSFFMKKIFTWIDAAIYSFIPFLSLLSLNILIIKQLNTSRKFSKQFTEPSARNESSQTSNYVSIVSSKQGSTVDVIISEISCSSSGYELSQTTEESLNDLPNGAIVGKTNDRRSRHGESQKKASSSSNITVMLLLVTFTFLALTSPIVISLVYKKNYWLPSTKAEKARARLVHAIVEKLEFTNHAINFLLYCISGRRFRQEFKQLVRRVCCNS